MSILLPLKDVETMIKIIHLLWVNIFKQFWTHIPKPKHFNLKNSMGYFVANSPLIWLKHSLFILCFIDILTLN